MAAESQSMIINHLHGNCDRLPERFIQRQDQELDYTTTSNPTPKASLPVIDVSLLTSSQSELEKLKSAVTTWGCFQAINHGIEALFLDKIREISKQFLTLPLEEKKKCLRKEDDDEGYGNDLVYSNQQTLDWTERLYIIAFPKHQQKLQFWPQSPTNFKEIVDEYCSKIDKLNKVILKALGRSLNLDENCFLDQYGPTNATMRARFCYYPPSPWADKILGLKSHSDGSVLTFLLQDKDVEGLEVLKDDQWFGVPIVPHALTVNIGDQMEIMSNGTFKSPIHRVTINSKNERISVALFCMPQTENDIGPVDGLVTSEKPRLYKNVTFSHDFFAKNLQQGKRWIDTCRI